MPVKSISTKEIKTRPPPRQRVIQNKIYHKTLNDFLKPKYLPCGWQRMYKDNEYIKFIKASSYDQDEYLVAIDSHFNTTFQYFGWTCGNAELLFDIKCSSLSDILNSVERATICCGVNISLEDGGESSKLHYKTKPASLFSDNRCTETLAIARRYDFKAINHVLSIIWWYVADLLFCN